VHRRFKELKSWQKGGAFGFVVSIIFVLILSAFASWFSQDSPDGRVSFFIAFIVSFPVYVVPTAFLGSVLGWLYGKFGSKLLVFIVGVFIIFSVGSAMLFEMATRVERVCGSKEECSVPATTSEPQKSPSGLYELQIVEGRDDAHYLQFQVLSTTRQSDSEIYKTVETVLVPEEKFYTRHRTYIMWDDEEDRVWVYSGDVGIFFWDMAASGQWEKQICIPRGENVRDVPIFLKEVLREQFHSCFYD